MPQLIAYISTPGGLTGAPRRLLTLASALRKEGFGVCIASQSGSELLDTARAEGHETAILNTVGKLGGRQGVLLRRGFWFKFRILIDLLRQNRRIFSCILHQKGDAVWIRSSKGIAFGALGVLISRRPLIWDVDFEPHSKGLIRLLHLLGLWSSSSVVFQHSGAPDKIFGTALTKRHWEKFEVLIPGINLDVLKPFLITRQKRKKSEKQPFLILQVGTICDRKNQKLLLRALEYLEKENLPKKIKMLIAGGLEDETYLQDLEQNISNLDTNSSVEILGWRTDVHELMVTSDLLVMPSKDEGIPNTVQEAMYIGLPVIVSDAGGMSEIVNHGDTGWVVSLDAPEKWAEYIKESMENDQVRSEISKAASAYAKKHFGTSEWGRQYAEIIKQAIADN